MDAPIIIDSSFRSLISSLPYFISEFLMGAWLGNLTLCFRMGKIKGSPLRYFVLSREKLFLWKHIHQTEIKMSHEHPTSILCFSILSLKRLDRKKDRDIKNQKEKQNSTIQMRILQPCPRRQTARFGDVVLIKRPSPSMKFRDACHTKLTSIVNSPCNSPLHWRQRLWHGI